MSGLIQQLSSGCLEVQNSQQVRNLPGQLSDDDLKPLLGEVHTLRILGHTEAKPGPVGNLRSLLFVVAGRLPSLTTLCIMNADLPSLVMRPNGLNAPPICRLLVQL